MFAWLARATAVSFPFFLFGTSHAIGATMPSSTHYTDALLSVDTGLVSQSEANQEVSYIDLTYNAPGYASGSVSNVVLSPTPSVMSIVGSPFSASGWSDSELWYLFRVNGPTGDNVKIDIQYSIGATVIAKQASSELDSRARLVVGQWAGTYSTRTVGVNGISIAAPDLIDFTPPSSGFDNGQHTSDVRCSYDPLDGATCFSQPTPSITHQGYVFYSGIMRIEVPTETVFGIDISGSSFAAGGVANAGVDPILYFDRQQQNLQDYSLEFSPLIGNENPTSAPEPATWISLLMGFSALGIAVRAKRGDTLARDVHLSSGRGTPRPRS
jgi:hypothetical protein